MRLITTHRLSSIRTAITVVTSLLLISGCSQRADDVLLDYQERVARVLDSSIQPASEQGLVFQPLPRIRPRDLRLTTAESRIDMLDFLKLSSCSIGTTIGQRNSSLGKMAAPSQMLHLERDFLIQGPSCVEHIAKDQKTLADTLQQILDLKYQQRMASWWNAWFTSEEWQHFINPASEAIGIESPEPAALSVSLQAVDFALRQGQRWQQGDYQYDSSQMEYQQQQLSISEALGQWLTSQRLISQISHQVADMLERREVAKPLCPAGVRTPKAEILHTVFLKFYVGTYQPYVSRVDRYGAELLSQLDTAMTLVDTTNETKTWRGTLATERDQMRTANMRQVKAWQATLRQCGLLPGEL